MTPGKAPLDTEPVFAAVITPHRSLGRRGFRIVMTLVCLSSVISSLPFVLLGAWPVAGFFGLDVAALAIAFLVNFRAGRAFEEVILTRLELLLRRVTHRGAGREWRLNPLWTRLDRTHDEEFGLQQLSVISRGERIVIAGALSPPERAAFAEAFGKALAEVKRGL